MSRAFLERCQRCSSWHTPDDLLRQIHVILAPRGENRIPYSKVNATGWTISGATLLGYFARGSSSQFIFTKNDNSVVRKEGAPTYLANSKATFTSSALDISGWANIAVGVNAGVYEAEMPDSFLLEMTLTDGSHDYSMGTVTVKGLEHFARRASIADIAAAAPSLALAATKIMISVTPIDSSVNFFLQRAYVLKDDATEQLRRGVFIGTNGAAVVRTKDTRQLITLVTCEKCRRKHELRMSTYVDDEPVEYPDLAEDTEVL